MRQPPPSKSSVRERSSLDVRRGVAVRQEDLITDVPDDDLAAQQIEDPTVQQWMRDKGICEDSNPTSWKLCLLGTITLALAVVTAFGARSVLAEFLLRTADSILPLHVHRIIPAAASSVHAQARKTAMNGDLDKAVTMYRKAELECDAKNPARAELLNDLGVALTASGNNEEAARYLKEAIELNPSLIAAYNNLAISQMLAGDKASAVATLEEAVRIQPQNEYAALKLQRMWASTSSSSSK
jgi:tetratricopeptide (TPR) repeat protein